MKYHRTPYPATGAGLPVIWKERRYVFRSRAEAANRFEVSASMINLVMKSGRRSKTLMRFPHSETTTKG